MRLRTHSQRNSRRMELDSREKVIEEVFATFKNRIFSTLGEEEVAEDQGEEE